MAQSQSGLMVICAAIYAFLNRVSLRFSSLNTGLKEWELKTQKDAFAFSYKVIKLGMLCLFACISIFGAAQALGFFGSIVKLELSAFAALTVILTYVVLFLPVLYIAWTIKPLGEEMV